MKALLEALQEGRLIELPESDKEKALQYLATLVEAIPEIKPGTDIVGSVLAREKQANTGLGFGWACPHARAVGDGDLLCAVGWSPTGVEYGSPDKLPAHILILYYIPDSEKNIYLKEVSSLIKAIQSVDGFKRIGEMKDLNEVRHRLLDLVGSSLETTHPDARARMIRLETRVAETTAATVPAAPGIDQLQLFPCWIATDPQRGALVLSQDGDLNLGLESFRDLPTALAKQSMLEVPGYRVFIRQASPYKSDRVLYDCIALKIRRDDRTLRPIA